MEKLKFRPKCIYKDRSIAWTATGFLVPCCWVDKPDGWDDETLKKFYEKKLHLDNNEKVEDIINSETWQKFFDMLKNNPEKAPTMCKSYCSMSRDISKTEEWF